MTIIIILSLCSAYYQLNISVECNKANNIITLSNGVTEIYATYKGRSTATLFPY